MNTQKIASLDEEEELGMVSECGVLTEILLLFEMLAAGGEGVVSCDTESCCWCGGDRCHVTCSWLALIKVPEDGSDPVSKACDKPKLWGDVMVPSPTGV